MAIINLFRTLNEAMYFKNSPRNTQYLFTGVQLLPNNINPYVQKTDTPNGIELEDWTVLVYSLCGKLLGDITDSFMVDSLTDSVNGNKQLYWSLTNIDLDTGWDLVYLKITQALGEDFYSTPFRLTNIESEKTTQFTYKKRFTDSYESISLTTWFRQEMQTKELTQYYQQSDKRTVTAEIKVNNTEVYETELMPISGLIKMSDILTVPYLYVENVRANIFEAPEIPKVVNQENFGTFTYQLSLDYNDIYKPITTSLGDFDSNDFDANDWLIYNQTPSPPASGTFADEFATEFE